MEKHVDRQSVSAQSREVPRKELLTRLDVDAATFDQVSNLFPVRWPRYYLDLTDGPEHPIARMGRPSPQERQVDPGDLADPVADRQLRPHPLIVQKHPDRVILLTTKRCHFYCRFCFRREEPFTRSIEPTEDDWKSIFVYLAANPEIEEPILSGGDPLTLSDAQLIKIKEALTQIPSIQRWRIHTRAPVHFPERITRALVSGLAGGPPLRVVTHFNHSSEITAETRRIVDLFTEYGIPLLNQTVLLAGVNDTEQEQRALWTRLFEEGITPHYLHHPDRVAGNAMFRVTIAQGRALFKALQASADLPLPKYVLDLPDGRGKIPVLDLKQTAPTKWHYAFADGTVSLYEDWG